MQELDTRKEATQKNKFPRSFLIWAILPVVPMAIFYYGSEPYKHWGAMFTLVFIGSLIVYRTLQQFLDECANAYIPYIVVTFLAIMPVAIFAPFQYSLIAWIVYGVIVGVATFYGIVKITVDAVKSFPEEMKRK
jgi:hypothetical protein